MDWEKLKDVDVVIMSDADIDGLESAVSNITKNVKILVMTEGVAGATVFYENKKLHFPAFPVKEIDPTGAGDIFATAFLVKYF